MRRLADLVRHLLGRLEIDVADQDLGALAREQPAILRAQPRAAAGDQRDLAFDPSHRRELSLPVTPAYKARSAA